MFKSRRDKGNFGEDAAAKELQRRGYRILERNYQVLSGELDIVAMDGDVLAIVEVKTRSSEKFGGGGEAVDQRKIKKMLSAVNMYIKERALPDVPVRFDVVNVTFAQDDSIMIEVIQNAVDFY